MPFAAPRLRGFVSSCLVLIAGALLAACSGPAAPPPAAPPAPAPKTASAPPPPPPAAAPSGDKACPTPAPCGDHCANQPYEKTECWTTAHGPAAADVVISASGNPMKSTNMLLCDSGPYALCFYSGPPDATGINKDNPRMPCVVGKDGTSASCTCEYFPSGSNFVDINGILNQNAWYETVQQCGHDGAGCANMAACGSGSDVTPAGCKMQEAKVCGYVRAQNAQQPEKSLVPGYDTISDFSMALATDYNMSKTTDCEGAYAGCMTAGCRFRPGETPAKGSLVECDCPIVTGKYQIGQTGADVTCAIPSQGSTNFVWSAAYTVEHGDPEAQH